MLKATLLLRAQFSETADIVCRAKSRLAEASTGISFALVEPSLATNPAHQDIMRLRPAPGNKQFTLVELLVVIAITAVLASLLLPALGQAKK